MKDVAASMLARVILEMPYILIFAVVEVVLIAVVNRGMTLGLCFGLFLLNVFVVAVCDLLDRLIDHLN